MSTVSIILVCTLLCIGLRLPIGILMSRSDRAQAIVTPILDVMQTIPSFGVPHSGGDAVRDR